MRQVRRIFEDLGGALMAGLIMTFGWGFAGLVILEVGNGWGNHLPAPFRVNALILVFVLSTAWFWYRFRRDSKNEQDQQRGQ